MKIYNDKSDEQLISLYVDGKNEAFDALLERHVEISLLSFRENPPPDYDFSFVNTKKNAVLCTEKKK